MLIICCYYFFQVRQCNVVWFWTPGTPPSSIQSDIYKLSSMTKHLASLLLMIINKCTYWWWTIFIFLCQFGLKIFGSQFQPSVVNVWLSLQIWCDMGRWEEYFEVRFVLSSLHSKVMTRRNLKENKPNRYWKYWFGYV